MANRPKLILRRRDDARLGGVCSGLGDYFDIDPVMIRLLFVAVTVFTGGVPGILIYLAAWVLIPQEPLRLPATSVRQTVEPVES